MMKNDLKILIAIPARGGSKRLERKNIINLNNKPLISYTINAAKKSNLTEHIYVCTEDDEIEKVSKQNNCKVFKIPKSMAGDLVSSTTPCIELLNYLTNKGENFDYIFNLQPTSPLRDEIDIKNSLKNIINSQSDFLVSTTFIDPHYFHWGIHKKKYWEMYFGEKFLIERPLLPPIYRPNGAIKLAKPEKLIQINNFFGKKLDTYEMVEEKSIHIATKFDLLCCETLLKLNIEN